MAMGEVEEETVVPETQLKESVVSGLPKRKLNISRAVSVAGREDVSCFSNAVSVVDAERLKWLDVKNKPILDTLTHLTSVLSLL